jgi:hypothetical protein
MVIEIPVNFSCQRGPQVHSNSLGVYHGDGGAHIWIHVYEKGWTPAKAVTFDEALV